MSETLLTPLLKLTYLPLSTQSLCDCPLMMPKDHIVSKDDYHDSPDTVEFDIFDLAVATGDPD